MEEPTENIELQEEVKTTKPNEESSVAISETHSKFEKTIKRVKYIIITGFSILAILYFIIVTIRSETSDKFQKIDTILQLVYKLNSNPAALDLKTFLYNEEETANYTSQNI